MSTAATLEKVGVEALKVAVLALPQIASWVHAAAATGDTLAQRVAAILPAVGSSRAAANALEPR